MPIDEALSGIKDEEKKDLEERTQENVNTELIDKAHSVLADYLISYFGRWNEQFLRTLGPYVLNMSPKATAETYDEREINIFIVNELDGELWNGCLRNISEGYSQDTDLAASGKIDVKSEGSLYIPGFKAITGGLSTIKRGSTNPHVLVMGMHSVYRPLAALVVDRAIREGEIKVIEGVGKHEIKGVLLSSIPSLPDFVEVAREYNIRELKPAIGDFNRVVDAYSEKWK